MNRGTRVKQPTNEPYFSFENFMFSNLTRVTTEEKECQICRRITTVAYLYKDITYYSHYECLSLYFLYRFFSITKSTHYSLKEANNASSEFSSDNANINNECDSVDNTNALNQDESTVGRDGSRAIGMELDGVESMSVDNAADDSATTSADVGSKGNNQGTTSTLGSNTQFITLYDIYKGNIQEPLDYDFYGTLSVEDRPAGNKKRRCYSCGITEPHFKCFVQECNNYMHVNCSGNGHMVVYTNPLVNLNVYTALRNKPMNVIAPIIINSSGNQTGEVGPSEQELVIDNYLKFNIIHVKDRFISYRFMLCYRHINDTIISNIKLLFLYRFMVIKEYQYVHTIINVIAEYNASLAKTKEDRKNRTLYRPLQVNGLTPSLSVSTPTSSIEMLGDKKLQPETIGINREARKPQKMLPKREVGMKNEFRRDMMMLRNRSELGRTEYDPAEEKEDRRNALMINNLMCEYNLYKKSNVQKNNKPFNPSNFNILFQPTTLSINIDTSSNMSGVVDVNLVNIRDDEVLENDIRLLLNLSGQITNIHELKKMTIQNEFNIQNVVQIIKQLLYTPKHTDSSELTHLKNINSMNKVSREGSEEYEQQETSTEALTEKDIYRSVMKKPKFALLKLYNKYVWMCMTKLESGFRGEEEAVDSRMVMLEYVVLSSMEYIYIKNIVNSMYYHNNTVMLLMHAGSKNNKLKGTEEEVGSASGASSAEGVSESTSSASGETGRGDVINLCGYSWDMNPPLYKFYKVHHSNTHSPTNGSSGSNTGSGNLVITSNTSTTKSTGGVNAGKTSDGEDTDQYQNCFVYKQSIAILSALKSINNNIETYKKNIEKNIAKDSVKYNNLCFDTGYVDFFNNVSTALHRYNHFKQSIRRSILHYNPVDASNNLDYMKHSDANDATSNADKGYSVNTTGDGKYIAGKTTDGNYTQNNNGAERSYNDNNGGDEDTNNNEGEGNESDNNGMDEDEPGYSHKRKSTIGGNGNGNVIGGVSGSLTSISSSGIKGGDSKYFGKKSSSTSRLKSEEVGYSRSGSSSSTKKEDDEEYHVAIDTSTGRGGSTTNTRAEDEKRGTSLASGRMRRSTSLSSGLRSKRHSATTSNSRYAEKNYEADTSVGAGGTSRGAGDRGVGSKASSGTMNTRSNAGSSNIGNHNANIGNHNANIGNHSANIGTSGINSTGIVSSGLGKRYSVIRSVDSNHGAINSGSNKRSSNSSGNNVSNAKGDDDVSNNEDEDNDPAEISEVGNQSSVGGGYGSYKSSIGTEETGGGENEKERGGKVKITKEYCSVCLLSELSHKHILIQCQKCYLRIHYKCYYNYRLSNLLNNPTASPAPKDKETKTGFYCDPCSKEYNQRYETNYNSAICISCLSSGGAMKAIYTPSSITSHSGNYQMYRGGYGGDKMSQGIGSNHQSSNYQYDLKINEMNKQGYRGVSYGSGTVNGYGGYAGGAYTNMNMRAKNTKGDKKSGEDEKWIHLICLVFLMPKVVCYDFVNLNQWYLPNTMETMWTCSICGVVGGIQVKCTYSSQGEKEEEYDEGYNVGVSSYRREMENSLNGMVNGSSINRDSMVNGSTINGSNMVHGTSINRDNMVNGSSINRDNMLNGTSMNVDGMVNGTNINRNFKNQQQNHNHVNSNPNGSNDKGYGDSKINGRCDCELTFHPMCCLLSGCYIRYSNKNNINLKQYQLHTFMSNFFNEAMQSEGQDEQNTYNNTNHTKNVSTRRDLDSVLNNLFQSIVLEPLCLKHTIELHTERFVREQTANRCYAYTHYLYHPDGFKNKKKYNSLPLEPIYSPVTITKNGPVKSQPRILPQHYDSNFPVDVVTKRAKYNEPYLISVVYGLPKAMCGDVPKYGITAITNYLSNSQQCNNQHNNSQSGTSQNNSQQSKGSEIKNMCDDKMWIPKLQQQYMINK
ncbi:hypothetical protein MACK_000618 [Theileria orientalis]|uniref:PHD-type domain-containing protein n=1 Tax=Theileria orientalis TaxID=68886 RepID=A0A976MA93_THEOR|nr:hypothetical protein MACK_000618 [Theileria orientalis]